MNREHLNIFMTQTVSTVMKLFKGHIFSVAASLRHLWPYSAIAKGTIYVKQLEEWNIIVSCDQLGDTLPAAPTNQCASSSQLHFHFFFFFILLSWALIIEVNLLANVFFKEDKVRFTTQAIQIDLVPCRLRQLTEVATGFAVARVTRVTGTSKRTCGIRASSWRMTIMGTCCAFVYVWKNK